jgi:hypothetical protein
MSETQSVLKTSDVQPRAGTNSLDTLAFRKFVEGLLDNYLRWAAGLMLQTRITDLSELPKACAPWIDRINATNVPWVAWETHRGLVTATGQYDHAQSVRTGSWVLFIEWSLPPHSRNGSWWRSDPRRPREWTAGWGHPSA